MLVTIPLDRQSFESDLTSAQKDFAKHYGSDFRSFTVNAIWECYEPYALLAKRVLESVRQKGVTVVERATLGDFHDLAPRYKVSTLLAHWLGPEFRPQDIVDPEAVAGFLVGEGIQLEDKSPIALAGEMNNILERYRVRSDWERPNSDGAESARQYWLHRGRLALELKFGKAVQGGAAVEFVEHLQQMKAVVDGLDSTFTGLLDLNICTSVVLAEEVRRRCPKALVLCAAKKSATDFLLGFYEQTISLLSERDLPYERAVFEIRKALIKLYERTGCNRIWRRPNQRNGTNSS